MMGRPPISRSGFGHCAVRGRSLVPIPAPRIKAVLNRRLFNLMPLLDVCLSQSTFPQYSILPLFHYSESLCLLFFELPINFYQPCHNEPWDSCGHDPEEIVLIAHLFLEPAARHGWPPHTQGHNPRRNGVMECFM